jgi:ApeA N-terminal domain 1
VKSKILEETGYFWWSDVQVPSGLVAPEIAVVGKLSIDDDGQSRLELEGVFPNEHGPWAALVGGGSPLPDGKCIHGILKGSNKTVRLSGVRRNGGQFKTNGISFERYLALQCLLGDGPFRDSQEQMEFHRLTVELKGFEEWFWLRGISAERTESGIAAAYSVPDKLVYPLEDGQLQIVFGVLGPYLGKHRGSLLTLTEYAEIVLIPQRPLPLAAIQAQYVLFADLFVLLTGSDYSLDWPMLTYDEGERPQRFQLYFARHVSRDKEPPGPREFWVSFPQVKERFGELFARWRLRRERWGPGVYLYLGTRRSVSLYEEHRFIMLVWGLESLHRRRGEPTRGSEKLQAKIARILAQIEEGKDKKWLERQLEHAGEPSLEQRIFETLEGLPLDVEKEALRKFAAACAEKRNEISHYGGRRHEGNYDNELEDLHKKSDALSNLYHILLLREIGVDDQRLHALATRGLRSFDIKSSFVEVGLLPASALKDPAVDAAVAAARAAVNPKAEGEAEDPPSPNPTNSAT